MQSARIIVPVAIALLLLYPLPVAADMGAPFSFNFVPQVRFDNLDDYPDYVFYLQYRSSSGNPYGTPLNLVRVEDHQIVSLGARRVVDIQLIAVPRRAVPKMKTERDDFRLADKEGTHRGQILDEIPFFTFDWNLYDQYVAPFRIVISDEKRSIELTRLPNEGIGPNVQRRIHVILILSSPLLAFLGIWGARRWFQSKQRADQAKRTDGRSPSSPD